MIRSLIASLVVALFAGFAPADDATALAGKRVVVLGVAKT